MGQTVKLSNPFIPNLPAAPEHFIGRGREVGVILNRLANPYNRGGSSISGSSGIGKTSLLHYLQSPLAIAAEPKLAEDKARFVYIPADIISPFSENAFWHYLLADLKQWLRGESQRQLAEVMEMFQPGTPLPRYHLTELFTFISRQQGALVVVLLDGFDKILEEMQAADHHEPYAAFLHSIRALLNMPAPRGFSLITASAKPLFDLFREVRWFGSDWYNNMVTLPLGPFNEAEANQLFDLFLQDQPLGFDAEERERLYQTSGGRPNELLRAAHELFQTKLDQYLELDIKGGILSMDTAQIVPFIPIIAQATEFVFNELSQWLDEVRRRASGEALAKAEQIAPNGSLPLSPAQFTSMQSDLPALATLMNGSVAQTNVYIIQGLVEQIQTHRKNLTDFEGTEAEFGALTPHHVKRGIEREASAIVEKAARLNMLLQQVYRSKNGE